MADDIPPPEVVAEFCHDSHSCAITSLGSGNINDTYLVQAVSHSFVLQKINNDVFPEPLRVIGNFQKISRHLTYKKKKSRRQLQVAIPVLTKDNGLFCRDNAGYYWRAQTYLPHESRRVLDSPAQAYRVGIVLATFHRLASDLDLQGFLDPLPGFHNLPSYLEDFDREVQGIKNDAAASEQFCFCLLAIERYRQQATILEKAKQAGVLTLQPVHGDPKVDNFIFDDYGKAIGLLDLDTVAMGLVHYDLGDCLRSCCNRAGETGGDGQSVTFDMAFCQALLDGYFSGSDNLLSKEQRMYIFDGVLLICFELGVRFFTDHLRGNLYFKVQQEGDNLLKAVKQFRLADNIAEREKEIRAMTIS